MSRQAFRIDSTNKDVFTAALERIYYIFYKYDQLFVSWSGGKDSTALHRLVDYVAHQLQRPYHVIFFDDELVDPDTEAFAYRIKAEAEANPLLTLHWICAEVTHTFRGGRGRSFYKTWDPAERDVWFRQPPDFAVMHEQLHPMPKAKKGRYHYAQLVNGFLKNVLGVEGNFASLLGIRVAESYNRSRMFTMSGTYLFGLGGWPAAAAKTITVAKPIYDWRTYDVWLLIKQMNADYSRFYDKMSTQGVQVDKQRVAPLGTTNSSQDLHLIQMFYPDAWDRLLRRLPEIKMLSKMSAFGNYSMNPRGQKPVGLTWMEWTFEVIKTLDPESQEWWYKYLKDVMMRFPKDFGFPIPLTPLGTPEGRSIAQGYCWFYIASAATKNDRLMGRPRDLSY